MATAIPLSVWMNTFTMRVSSFSHWEMESSCSPWTLVSRLVFTHRGPQRWQDGTAGPWPGEPSALCPHLEHSIGMRGVWLSLVRTRDPVDTESRVTAAPSYRHVSDVLSERSPCSLPPAAAATGGTWDRPAENRSGEAGANHRTSVRYNSL